MKVSLIQMNIKWSDVLYNLDHISTAIHNSEKADLYVLPEMFATGFNVRPDEIAEEENGVVFHTMVRLAKETNAAIAGSVAVKDNSGRYFNRLYFVKPDGSSFWYDKHHLFSYGNENKNYSAGDAKCIVEWRGIRFLLQVCYDLRFPVFSRNKRPYYDCIIYVASWPESRRMVWDILLQARALENQCYVVGVNRIGDDSVCHYNGGTRLINAYGRISCTAKDNVEEIVSAELDIEKLSSFREKFAVLEDQDI